MNKGYEIIAEPNVEMKTRDGVTLRADVYRPKSDEKFPVLLSRTPYNKHSYGLTTFPAASRGYVLIVQDTRGRFDSDGSWYPFKYEANDTYDAVEWAAGLEYSNGKVGMFGPSYLGVPQILGATAAPPHLVAIAPDVTGSDYHSNWTYQGGAFSLFFNRSWASGFIPEELRRRASQHLGENAYYDEKRTLSDASFPDPGSASSMAEYYFDWVAHPSYDDYWKGWSGEERYERIRVPALHMAAWYDLFFGGSLANYTGFKTRGATEGARHGQRLIIVPGGHAGVPPVIGEVDFGPQSVFDTWAYTLRWFDWVIKGIDDGIASEKPVKVFVMGENVWRDEDSWPLERAVETAYYLHSQGDANSIWGDGSLSALAPTAEPADKYLYDPDDPVPTQGGVMGWPKLAGPVDQRSVEGRSDVLVYSTGPFEAATEVTGPIRLDLYVSSSAADTDFTGKLVDVWPNGFAQNLTEGILRARYRNSMERPEPMIPGQIYKVSIDLWATANVFLPGHRLRLEVASSNYPRFDRNLNTSLGADESARRIVVTNTVYHDEEHPSALILPIVP